MRLELGVVGFLHVGRILGDAFGGDAVVFGEVEHHHETILIDGAEVLGAIALDDLQEFDLHVADQVEQQLALQAHEDGEVGGRHLIDAEAALSSEVAQAVADLRQHLGRVLG